jgi:outer membrane protein OmpA-like peptidoglycan-associated protein
MGRHGSACLSLLAGLACATSTPPPDHADDDTEVELMSVVVEKCKVPELNAFFYFGSDRIRSGHGNLDKLADCLVDGALRGERLLLIGHTDATGPDSFNASLGLWRAQRVRDYLIGRGVDPSRIEIQSRGKQDARPEPANHPTDRRVDIRLLH